MTNITSWNSPNPVNVANGGTGNSSMFPDRVLLSGGTTTSPIVPLANGTTGQVLTISGGTPNWEDNADPEYGIFRNVVLADNQTYGDAVYIDASGEAAIADASSLATSKVIGIEFYPTRSAAQTGTYYAWGYITNVGVWSWTNIGGYIYLSTAGTTTNTLTETAPTGYGEVVCPLGIILSATAIYFWPNFEPYVIGSDVTYEEVTDATKTIVPNIKYGANKAGGVTFTLPSSCAVGKTTKIIGIQGNWSIAQNAGQTIYFGNTSTTTGAGGSLTATDDGDCIELVCIVADTDFRVVSSVGNITVA